MHNLLLVKYVPAKLLRRHTDCFKLRYSCALFWYNYRSWGREATYARNGTTGWYQYLFAMLENSALYSSDMAAALPTS
jgi:hypothetical protein